MSEENKTDNKTDNGNLYIFGILSLLKENGKDILEKLEKRVKEKEKEEQNK